MKNYLSFIVFLILASSCEEDSMVSLRGEIDCSKLKTELSIFDFNYCNEMIDSICLNLEAQPTADDTIGHKNNSEELIEELTASCDELTFELGCYACMESFPPLSNINIYFDSLGSTVQRNLRLRVPSDDFMSVEN